MIGTAFSLLIGLMALSLPVAAALGLMGYILSQKYAFFPLTGALGELAWNTSNDFILIAAPMFVMMGELMHRSGMSERLFSADGIHNHFWKARPIRAVPQGSE